jgi:pantoate--beta-alanine ligase
LALSSRNAYLDGAQRAAAPALYRVLCEVATRVAGGQASAPAIEWGRAELEAAGFDKVDYLEVCDAATLEPLAGVEAGAGAGAGAGRAARAFAAAFLGATRLIDNVAVG